MLNLMVILAWLCMATIIFCPIYAIYRAKKIVNRIDAREKEFFDNLKITHREIIS